MITEGRNGQLVISSQDVEALDALEKLIEQMMPRQADYEVFRLKHASPFAVEITLEQIFGLDQTATTATSGLPAAGKRYLQFISDVDTGTLLVQNATSEQLEKIRGLIELYDQPESQDVDLRRETKVYEVKYSRADAVAEVVKEVYRDLLSATDKTFTRERGREGDSPSRGVGYGINYGSKIPQFKGLLSVGVEENSNTLIVSAPAYLMEDVMRLVEHVDQRAAGHKTKVLSLNGVGAGRCVAFSRRFRA